MLNLNPNAKCKIGTSPYGTSLQEYKLSGLLGKGGFSDVFRAKCLRTGQKVAIKMIKKQVITNEGLFDRISQEINIQSELDHPSILKLYTAFDDAGCVCIVLELCSNGELLKYVNKSSSEEVFSEHQAKVVIKQIVDGLEYLHKKNILHRDIKLANILLTDKMQIKIADFGLATRLRYPGECHLTMCGTPNYISPEIVSRKTHGPEVDVWSLGCLLYTLLVGKPPFEMDTVKNTLNRVVAGEYRMPPELSSSAKDLISRLLQKNPQKRMTLQEIRDHPFISDKYSPTGQKWISSDSGFDTCTVSSKNLSSRFHSLDRKPPSGESNGYGSFDTPKSSKHNSSQDRRFTPEPLNIYHSDLMQLMPENDFSADYDLHNRIERDYDTSFAKKLTNIEFSPVKRRAADSAKSCEVFYENEFLNRGSCNCSKCKNNKSCENMKLASYKSDVKSRIRGDGGARKMKFTSKSKSETYPTVPTEFSSESDDSEDRIKVIPFTTERLKPARHRLRNTIFSILENGDVCVEFLRSKSKSKEIVGEVVRISKNGLKMLIYYPNKGHGTPPTDHPPPLPLCGADAVFNCETLSKENWKKYSYAARFVDMVQSKTPKLTLYTNKARCVLMENLPEPDFEIIYYDGAKITKSRKGIKLTENNGHISVLDDTGQSSSKDSRLAEHYKFYKECYEHCSHIEKQLSSTCLSKGGTIFKVFPAILGKKPTFAERESEWNCAESPNLFHSTKYPT